MNCLYCKHYYTTWDVNYPKGCKFFKVKGKQNPSLYVKEAIGKDCPKFEEKEGIKK